MNAEQAAALRAPFPPEAIGRIPKGGQQLDYVGHAAVTDRLLAVDPEWTWNPHGVDEHLNPIITQRGNDSVMWIELIVCGVTRLGVGIVATKSFELEKQLISDAIRNAAMRFGVALDLWSKEDLGHNENAAEADGANAARGQADLGSTNPPTGPRLARQPVAEVSAPPAFKARRQKLKARCVALTGDGVSVADAREAAGLPIVDACSEEELSLFEHLVLRLEAQLEKPFFVTPGQEMATGSSVGA